MTLDQYIPLLIVFGPPVAVTVLLAIPPARRTRSWLRFCVACLQIVFGMGLPLVAFLASAELAPDWKGGCDHGWIDCLHAGKLWLLPLVLWATVAFYAYEVYRAREPLHPWITLGYLLGAIVAIPCCAFGYYVLWNEGDGSRWFLLIPLAVAAWYGWRAWQFLRSDALSPEALLWTFVGATPFWLISLWQSRHLYTKLPDQPPDCFVVTAAARGHAHIVGPRTPVLHHGRIIPATRQLQTFWEFEARWSRAAPRSHAATRRIYNRVGPPLARRICHPIAADAAFLALKPLEWLARFCNRP